MPAPRHRSGKFLANSQDRFYSIGKCQNRGCAQAQQAQLVMRLSIEESTAKSNSRSQHNIQMCLNSNKVVGATPASRACATRKSLQTRWGMLMGHLFYRSLSFLLCHVPAEPASDGRHLSKRFQWTEPAAAPPARHDDRWDVPVTSSWHQCDRPFGSEANKS